jgi:hypothetical protein
VTVGISHVQLDQTSDDAMYQSLVDLAFEDVRVEEQPSRASLPGVLGLNIFTELPVREDAMIVVREFAHIHAEPGRGSLHLRLPGDLVTAIVAQGWDVWHPFALDGSLPGLVMVFAPWSDDDLGSLKLIIDAAIDHATRPVDS